MKIITDTGSLFSPEEGKKMGIDVLPLNVTINKKSYQEFVDIQSPEFLKLIDEGHMPTSSQPSIGLTMELFEKYSDEEILVINMADGLSGTYQSTLGVKQGMDHNENIHVMNSMTLCAPQRYLIEKAVRLRDAGHALEHIKQELHKSIATETSFLIPNDFGYLKRGGRLTPLAATVGSMLRIKPIMIKTRDGKRIEKFTMKKTMKSAIKEVVKYMKENGVNEDYKIFISHANVLEQAKSILGMLHEAFENVTIELYDLSPAFITQGGPGCIAIQMIKM